MKSFENKTTRQSTKPAANVQAQSQTPAAQVASQDAPVRQLKRFQEMADSSSGAQQISQLQSLARQTPATSKVVQRIFVGKNEIKTAEELAPLLGMDEDELLQQFNTRLGEFPPATKTKFNTFLTAKTSKVRGVSTSQPDAYLDRLRKWYVETYFQREDSTFTDNLDNIEQNQNFRNIMDPEGINYAEGEDDGASVKDTYDSTLACSLFAILQLKPNFLGAATPKQLHYIFRSNPKTKGYDNDKEVAQIRISAGLNYRAPGNNENTVSKFMTTRTEQDRAKKYIIDPGGQAHTFTLAYSGGRWKRFDNDNQGGVVPDNDPIRVYWYV